VTNISRLFRSVMRGRSRRVLTFAAPGMICFDFGALQLQAFLFALAPTGRDELARLCSPGEKAALIDALTRIGARKAVERVEPRGVAVSVLDQPVIVPLHADAPTPAEFITWRAFIAIRAFVEVKDAMETDDEAVVAKADPWQSASLDGFIKALVQDANISLLIASITDKAAQARPLERISAGPPCFRS
jgi:hypothetical protein